MTVAGTPNSRTLAALPSFEPRHGEAPASRHVVRKPDPAGRQAGQEPARTVYQKSQLGGTARVLVSPPVSLSVMLE
jgi:hypothetical protein